MKRGNPFDRLIRQLRESRAPAAFTLLGVAFVFWLAIWLLSGGTGAARLLESLVFQTEGWIQRPWTALTYIFANPAPLAILFVGIGLFFFGAALERSWGTRRFIGFFASIAALTALVSLVGSAVLGTPYVMSTMGMPISCAIIAWASMNPSATVLLWMVLPIKAVWIGWITFILALVSFTYAIPGMAPFLAVPLVSSWAYASGRLRLPSMPTARTRGREGDYGGVDWEKRRQAEDERRRLKELFERSWRDDTDAKD